MKKGLSLFLFLLAAGALFIFKQYFTSNKQGQQGALQELIENYAYYEIKPEAKEHLNQIKEKLRTLSGNIDWQIIRSDLQAVHDAHLEARPLEELFLHSSLELHHNSTAIKGLGQIVAIDHIATNDWIAQNQHLVSYSSPWARDYRTLKLLERYPSERGRPPQSVTVRDEVGEKVIGVQWSNTSTARALCVSSQLISPDIMLLKIHTLWCELDKGQGRDQIINNFKQQFDLSLATHQGDIVLDLRDNSGGGDQETRYVLEHFVQKEVFLYQFRSSHSQNKSTELLNPNPEKLREGKVAVLIDSGCGSSCEVIASVLKHGQNVVLVGFQTHGTAGDPVTKVIDNWVLSYPSALVWQQDGQLYEGIGVRPDVDLSGHDILNEKELLQIALKNLR